MSILFWPLTALIILAGAIQHGWQRLTGAALRHLRYAAIHGFGYGIADHEPDPCSARSQIAGADRSAAKPSPMGAGRQ